MNVTYDRSIVTAVQKLTGTFNQDTVFLVTANVISVDEIKGLCSVETISGNASTTLNNVELQTVISDGILIVPRVDSEVKVIYSKYTTPFIVQYSEVEKIYFSADLVQFDDGVLGGMVKVIELTTKLNNLENDINILKTAFNSWAPISGDGGAALKTVAATWSGSQLTPTQQADIENTKITQ